MPEVNWHPASPVGKARPEHVAWVLERALEKLNLYRAQHSGEYIGGMEFRALRMEIEDTLKAVMR